MRGLVISIMAFMTGQYLANLMIGGKITGLELDFLLSPTRSASITSPSGMCFKSDGTKLYVMNGSTAYQYSLSTAWDISTLTYDSITTATSSGAKNLSLKSDGTKLYWVADNSIYEKSLPTPWDLSSSETVFDNAVSTPMVGITAYNGLFIKPDGTSAYILGEYGIAQWNLGTAWNFMGESRSGSDPFKVLSTGAVTESSFYAVTFNSSGTKMFAIGSSEYKIYQWNLSTAWDISTLTYSGNFFSVPFATGSLGGLYLGNSDASMYLANSHASPKIYQFSFGETLPSITQSKNTKRNLGAFRRLIRSGTLNALQNNTTSASIIAASQIATAEIAAL